MSATGAGREPQEATVDDIPVIWIEPDTRRPGTQLALWLPWLSGPKEACVPFLTRLADAGFVAVSFDPWLHGARAPGPVDDLFARVFNRFREQMWPILGHSTLDALRVIDWAVAKFGIEAAVVAGGVSMGGDISVALAGIDARVTRVAAIVATPDWTRPGMRDLNDPERVLPQGEPGTLGQWFYDQLDPMTHLDAYTRGAAIAFECDAADTHVPPAGALRFQAALRDLAPAAAGQIRVTLHEPGLGHLEGARNPALSDSCLAWLTDE